MRNTTILVVLTLVSSLVYSITDEEHLFSTFGGGVFNVSASERICDSIFVGCSSERKVENLFLQSKSFSGTLPSSLKELKALSYLDISYNNISGQLDASMLPSSLTHIILSNNYFTGPFPDDLAIYLPKLSLFYFNLNRFRGPIPAMAWKQIRNLNVMLWTIFLSRIYHY